MLVYNNNAYTCSNIIKKDNYNYNHDSIELILSKKINITASCAYTHAIGEAASMRSLVLEGSLDV